MKECSTIQIQFHYLRKTIDYECRKTEGYQRKIKWAHAKTNEKDKHKTETEAILLWEI